MAKKTRISIRKVIVACIWLLLGAGVVVLLIAAMNRNSSETVAGIRVELRGHSGGFVDVKEVGKMVREVIAGKPDTVLMQEVDLRRIERNLRRNEWVHAAEVYFDNKNVLQVQILEKLPVARVFTTGGGSFYLDSSLSILPVKADFTSRLPVFTGFSGNKKSLTYADSMLMKDIKTLALYLQQDAFWMAQIDQIDITAGHKFEMVPKMGDQIIRFGKLEDYQSKFNNLFAFYEKVLMPLGWHKYSVIDVQYKGQVVALRKDAQEYRADSLKSVRIMKKLIEELEKKLRDTSNVQLPQQEHKHTNIDRSREVPVDGFSEAARLVVPAAPTGQPQAAAPAGTRRSGTKVALVRGPSALKNESLATLVTGGVLAVVSKPSAKKNTAGPP